MGRIGGRRKKGAKEEEWYTFPISVQLRDHDICRVRDDCTGKAGNVTSEETNSRLLKAVVAFFGLAHVFVDLVDGLFERGKFAHCIGDLTCPEGVEAFV
jgi:hypothetical protein